jgi:hypothetical protein
VWALIALHGKADTFEEVVGLSVLGVPERRDRRAEDGWHVPSSRLTRAFGRDFQKVAIADSDRFDKDRLIFLRFTIGKGAQRNKTVAARVLEH